MGDFLKVILLAPIIAFLIYLFAIGGLALFIFAGILFGHP